MTRRQQAGNNTGSHQTQPDHRHWNLLQIEGVWLVIGPPFPFAVI
jgi:hypothetical protein